MTFIYAESIARVPYNDKWLARTGEGGSFDVQFFFRHRLACAPPDCNFKFLRCNGTERLNFFASFSGMKGRKEGEEKKKKEE